eukprot:scaffold158828_cov32-Tisochrysis_lutea.AAC.7
MGGADVQHFPCAVILIPLRCVVLATLQIVYHVSWSPVAMIVTVDVMIGDSDISDTTLVLGSL